MKDSHDSNRGVREGCAAGDDASRQFIAGHAVSSTVRERCTADPLEHISCLDVGVLQRWAE